MMSSSDAWAGEEVVLFSGEKFLEPVDAGLAYVQVQLEDLRDFVADFALKLDGFGSLVGAVL